MPPSRTAVVGCGIAYFHRPLKPAFGYAARRTTTTPQVWDRQMLDHGEVVLKPSPSRPPLLAESRIVPEQLSLAVIEEAPIHSTSWCWHLVTAAHIHTIVQLHGRCQVVIFHRSVKADPPDAIAGTARRLWTWVPAVKPFTLCNGAIDNNKEDASSPSLWTLRWGPRAALDPTCCFRPTPARSASWASIIRMGSCYHAPFRGSLKMLVVQSRFNWVAGLSPAFS